MTKIIDFKKGEAFQLVLSLPADTDLPSIEGYVGHAQLRKEGDQSVSGLIAELTFGWVASHNGGNIGSGFWPVPDSPQFTLVASTTDAWPVGMAELDVRFIVDNEYSPNYGESRYTQSVPIRIRTGVTQ